MKPALLLIYKAHQSVSNSHHTAIYYVRLTRQTLITIYLSFFFGCSPSASFPRRTTPCDRGWEADTSTITQLIRHSTHLIRPYTHMTLYGESETSLTSAINRWTCDSSIPITRRGRQDGGEPESRQRENNRLQHNTTSAPQRIIPLFNVNQWRYEYTVYSVRAQFRTFAVLPNGFISSRCKHNIKTPFRLHCTHLHIVSIASNVAFSSLHIHTSWNLEDSTHATRSQYSAKWTKLTTRFATDSCL